MCILAEYVPKKFKKSPNKWAFWAIFGGSKKNRCSSHYASRPPQPNWTRRSRASTAPPPGSVNLPEVWLEVVENWRGNDGQKSRMNSHYFCVSDQFDSIVSQKNTVVQEKKKKTTQKCPKFNNDNKIMQKFWTKFVQKNGIFRGPVALGLGLNFTVRSSGSRIRQGFW